MKQYSAKNIRNIALVGHSGTGKTSLAEAILYLSGGIDRWAGCRQQAVCDFDPEEIKRKASVSMAVAPAEWKDVKINIIDTPGLFDFPAGERRNSRSGKCCNHGFGKSGLAVGAEKGFKAATKRDCKIFLLMKWIMKTPISTRFLRR